MRKIKLFPAPHVELRVSVSDEMVEDYRECRALLKAGDCSKSCSVCSWYGVDFGDKALCSFREMEQLLEDNHG